MQCALTHTPWRAQPDLEAFTFHGHVSTTVEVHGVVTSVTCHCKDLVVSSVTAVDRAGRQVATSITYDASDSEQTVTATFAQPLAQGSPTRLEYVFTGYLNDQMHGFYRSSYAGGDGKTRYMAVTQFESTDARRAFPCWDEPSLKATCTLAAFAPVSARLTLPPLQSPSRCAVRRTALR